MNRFHSLNNETVQFNAETQRDILPPSDPDCKVAIRVSAAWLTPRNFGLGAMAPRWQNQQSHFVRFPHLKVRSGALPKPVNFR